jgi:peptidoglycan/xylan/chitin deacetylase (PgdA/CDA1 family)
MPSTRRVINLTFHGIGAPKRVIPPEEEPMWLRPEQFATILDAIAGRDNVGITFDDGNISDIEIALPDLQERGLTASFFVLAGRLGQVGSLGGPELRALRGAGMTIGLHGMAHRAWRGMDDRQLEVELVDARIRLEEVLGERVMTAACPFGAYGRRALNKLRDQGFSRVYTSDRGPTEADAWMQPRNTIIAADSAQTVKEMCSSIGQSFTRWGKMMIKRHIWA